MDADYRSGFVAVGFMAIVMTAEVVLLDGVSTWAQIGTAISVAVVALLLMFVAEKIRDVLTAIG